MQNNRSRDICSAYGFEKSSVNFSEAELQEEVARLTLKTFVTYFVGADTVNNCRRIYRT